MKLILSISFTFNPNSSALKEKEIPAAPAPTTTTSVSSSTTSVDNSITGFGLYLRTSELTPAFSAASATPFIIPLLEALAPK